MGALRETARASHDIKLLKQDILSDIMSAYDDWADMEHGPGGMDVAFAEIEYRMDGLNPDEAEEDLRKAMHEHYVEMKAHHE
jgi:hypothetical protein